ncbi:MAG: hypothetical protein ACRDK9_01430 [Solirubrobacterales bacterium]
MIVAVIALVLAMSGAALALPGKNSVKSNDIAPGAVKGRDIATGAVKPHKLDLIKVDGEAGPLPTASIPATDLGGPSVTVNVPHTGLVAIYARGTGEIDGGGENARAQVHLFEPRLLPNAPRVLEFDSPDPQLRISTPGVGMVDGTPNLARGGWIVFPADKGRYTFSLFYSVAGGGTGTFTNTGLWAGVIG